MANTIATATGMHRTKTSFTSRLGSEAASVRASTWKTFARAYIYKDGSGYVTVERSGREIHRFDFGPEE